MIGRKTKPETGRKPARKRKWEEDSGDDSDEPQISAAELEQWREKEREEEEREERARKQREAAEALERRLEAGRHARERPPQEAPEEAGARSSEGEEEGDAATPQLPEREQRQYSEPAPVLIESSSPFVLGSKRAVCMTYLQFRQRGGPPCPRGDGCPDRHTDDSHELSHWTRYFGERHCKFGAACRLMQHCLYRHPAGALAEREKQKPEGEQLGDKRQICMFHLQLKHTGGPYCPRAESCPDRHSEDIQEIFHWVKYFGERPCKFGTGCRLLPHCLYRHPQGLVPEELQEARARALPSGVLVPPPSVIEAVLLPFGGAPVPRPPRPVCVPHLRAKLFGQPACAQADGCPHQHPEDTAEVQRWAERFARVACGAGAACRLRPCCLWGHPAAAAAPGHGAAATAVAMADADAL